MKKVAETVCNETSATALHGMLRGEKNAVAKFVEREGNPKRYFSDNGLLNLFLIGKEPALFENEVAVAMRDAFGEKLHYLKSSKNGIDVDFMYLNRALQCKQPIRFPKAPSPAK